MGRALHLSLMETNPDSEPVKLASLAVFTDPENYTETISDFLKATAGKIPVGEMTGLNNAAINQEAINLILQGKLYSIQKIEHPDRQSFTIILKGQVNNDKHTGTAPRISR